jgi:hypothetical protein
MAAKSFEQAVAQDLTSKAVMWGPAIAGGLLLGPIGGVLGVIASVVILASGSNDSSPPPEDND